MVAYIFFLVGDIRPKRILRLTFLKIYFENVINEKISWHEQSQSTVDKSQWVVVYIGQVMNILCKNG